MSFDPSTIATVSNPGLGGSLEVTEVVGEEQLSGLFRYVVHVTRSGGSPTPPYLDAVIGAPITLNLRRPKGRRGYVARSVQGIVARVVEHGSGPSSSNAGTSNGSTSNGSSNSHAHLSAREFEIEIRPRLWRLMLSRHNRTFTDRKVVQNDSKSDTDGVLERLLKDAGYSAEDITIQLEDKYAARSHLVQHGETDFAFFQRLASEAGVAYFLDGTGSVHLVDRNSTDKLLAYSREMGSTTHHSLRPTDRSESTGEGALHSYSLERNAVPASLRVRDTRAASATLPSESVTTPGMGTMGDVHEYPGGLTSYTKYSFGGNNGEGNAWTQGPELQKRRAAQLQAARTLVRGETTARLLGIGMVFELEKDYCGSVVEHFETKTFEKTSQGSGGSERRPRTVAQFAVQRLSVAVTRGAGYLAEFEAVPLQSIKGGGSGKKGNKEEAPSLRGPRYAQHTSSPWAEGHYGVERWKRGDVLRNLKKLRSSLDSSSQKKGTASSGAGTASQTGGGSGTEDLGDVLDLLEASVHAEEGPGGSWYGMNTHATVGPGTRTMPGLHLGTVQQASTRTENQKKFAMVKVRLDADHDPDLDDQEVWARVMGPWGGGLQWGSQFVPREGMKVVVAYPGASGNASPIVLGTLYDGNHPVPFEKGGETLETYSGLRSRSGRGSNDAVHNELRFRDKKDEEEVRIAAPKYWAAVAGLDKDLRDTSDEYYVLKDGDEPRDFKPHAEPIVTKSVHQNLPSKSDAGWHMIDKAEWLVGYTNEWAEYGRVEEDIDSGRYGKIDNNKIKLKPTKDASVLQDRLTSIGIDKFMRIPQSGDFVLAKLDWSKVNPDTDSESLGWVEYVEEYISSKDDYSTISYEEWSELPRKTVIKDNSNGFDTLKNNTGNLKQYRVSELGKDAFKVSRRGPFQVLYRMKTKNIKDEDINVVNAKDAYKREVYGSVYEKVNKPPVQQDDETTRSFYTDGGALDACKGPFRVYTYDDRIEIFRNQTSQNDILGAERNENWEEPSNLPGKLKNFEDAGSGPIVVMNKDGGVSIKATDGINIESGDSINIQAKRDVNIKAGRSIDIDAKQNITEISKNILIGQDRDNPSRRSQDVTIKTINLVTNSTFHKEVNKLKNRVSGLVKTQENMQNYWKSISAKGHAIQTVQIAAIKNIDATLLANVNLLNISTDILNLVNRLAYNSNDLGSAKTELGKLYGNAGKLKGKLASQVTDLAKSVTGAISNRVRSLSSNV